MKNVKAASTNGGKAVGRRRDGTAAKAVKRPAFLKNLRVLGSAGNLGDKLLATHEGSLL